MKLLSWSKTPIAFLAAALLCAGLTLRPMSVQAQSMDNDSDFLAKTSIDVPGPNASNTVSRMAANLRGVFENYQPALDSSSKIVKPLTVTGTATRPTVTVSIEKCVFVICETVDLVGEVDWQEVSGPCNRNFIMNVDTRKSSSSLSDVYDRLDVSICFTANSGLSASPRGLPDRLLAGSGKLVLSASVHHAADYNTGAIQRELFKLLQMQVAPITTALRKSLTQN